jgi:hypothetical protein
MGFMAAWLLGESIVIWREVTRSHKAPAPAQLLGVTGLFAVLALIADVAPNARRTVVMLAFALDLAGLLQILPAGLFGEISASQATEAQAEGVQGSERPTS